MLVCCFQKATLPFWIPSDSNRVIWLNQVGLLIQHAVSVCAENNDALFWIETKLTKKLLARFLVFSLHLQGFLWPKINDQCLDHSLIITSQVLTLKLSIVTVLVDGEAWTSKEFAAGKTFSQDFHPHSISLKTKLNKFFNFIKWTLI